MKTKILFSTLSLFAMVAVIAGGTTAMFSDVETAEANVVTAGSVTLLINSITHTYAGDAENAPIYNDNGVSFELDDTKPLDEGSVDYQILNGANEAYVCAMVTETANADNSLVNPEVDLGDDLTEGELQDYLNFQFASNSGSLTDISGEWQDVGIVSANTPTNSVIDYCFGEYAGGSCVANTTGNVNEAQTDSVTFDIEFYAEQTRNNPDFTCADLNEDPVTQPTIGANLEAYVAPTAPDVTVLAGESIQAAIDAATEGQTIVVEPGTYSPFVVDKGLVVAAAAGPDSGTPVTIVPADATFDQLALVDADNVTITGFVFDGQNLPSTGARTAGIDINSTVVNPDVANIEISFNEIINLSSATASGQTGSYALKLFSENLQSMTNVLVANNVISGVNTVAGGGYGIQSVGERTNMTIEFNTITDINSDSFSLGLAIDAKVEETNTEVDIFRNVVETGADADIQVEKNASAGTVVINENNLVFMLHGGGGYIATDGVDGTVDAENNWWGDADASDNVAGSIDFDPEAVAAFPTN